MNTLDPRNHSADTNNLTNTTKVKTPGPQVDPSDLEEQAINGSMSDGTDDEIPEGNAFDADNNV